MHDVFVVGIPLLAGIFFNRGDAKDLRSEMNSRFDKVEGHLGRIDADLRQFYHLTSKHDGRLNALERRG